MGAANQQLPSWRFIVPVVAALAALAALTALTLNSHGPSVLAEKAALPQLPGMAGKPGAKEAMPTEKDVEHLFNYLSKESYTPSDEKHYLAQQLGVKVPDNKDLLWKLPEGQKPAADAQSPDSRYNVPYFSTYLLPQRHYTRGGMHAATAYLEDERARAGLADDDGRYLSKEQGQKLSKELTASIDQIFGKQMRMEAAAHYEGPPISRANDQKLAASLIAGEDYALLPNHGKTPVWVHPKFVSKAAGAKLAKELLKGEEEALAAPKPAHKHNYRALGLAADSKLVKGLEEAQAYANLPHHGKPVHVKWGTVPMTPAQKAEDKRLILARKIWESEQAAAAKAKAKQGALKQQEQHVLQARASAALKTDAKLEKYLQQGLHEIYNPKKIAAEWGEKKVHHLSLAQDKNVARYLSKGIDKIWPEPKAKQVHYLGKRNGEILAKEGMALEYNEFKHDKAPVPKFLSAQRGPALAHELQQSLAHEQGVEGPYMAHYYARMRGAEAAHPSPRPFYAKGMSKKEVQEKRLAESLQAGLDYAEQMKHLAKGKKHKGPKMLTGTQGRALADYLVAPKHVGRSEASALGFAV